jgi:hypothetical protein
MRHSTNITAANFHFQVCAALPSEYNNPPCNLITVKAGVKRVKLCPC